ncbi:NAD(P)/FAD-dependent oxidoreductase [Novosphingobium sp. CCH12-A3]|uniref:NAD(P)/FAD-dependent oxidoreductase n=1 Tax=Novosphingobium sp. CCH12-A3 TaxID=1768752 RepID=UPI0009EABCDB|nr:NAD(P)/FAD-dependent oxidoreductase [Novosphingobium sp. CCH12-A3]
MRPRIVIVGAGFGGMAAVKALKRADADVTLIDRTNHHLFQPLLYQVATAALSPADIATASRVLLRRHANATVVMADVVSVDAEARYVRLADGRTINYDFLVLATGAAYSFFGHGEWANHAKVLKSLEDALSIRETLLAAFERAEQCNDPDEVRRLLTFVVVGGGPTGVELAGTIAELARTTLARDFRHIDPASARIILCEAGNHILGAFPGDLPDYAARALRSLGVEVRLGEAVSLVDAEGIVLADERIAAETVLWCAGTQARPAADWLEAEAARNGAIKVAADCSVPGRPGVFAIGDVASFDGGSGKPLPGLAPVAKQQGRYVGRLLAARIAGRAPPPPFRYRDLGTMAVIGRSRAVADFGSFQLKGFLAWLAWSMVHLMLLVDFRSRMMVYVNWSWAWFTYGRGARLLTGRGELPQRSQATEISSKDFG